MISFNLHAFWRSAPDRLNFKSQSSLRQFSEKQKFNDGKVKELFFALKIFSCSPLLNATTPNEFHFSMQLNRQLITRSKTHNSCLHELVLLQLNSTLAELIKTSWARVGTVKSFIAASSGWLQYLSIASSLNFLMLIHKCSLNCSLHWAGTDNTWNVLSKLLSLPYQTTVITVRKGKMPQRKELTQKLLILSLFHVKCFLKRQ